MKMCKAVILSVDDDINDQVLIQAAFKEAGVADTIQSVNDGAEAIAYLKGHGKYADRERFLFPTFILTDLKMPRINGFELLRFLKSNPQSIVVPAVVFTSSSNRDDIKKAYLFGANAYHIKCQTRAGLSGQLKLVHDYWMNCEVPDVDKSLRSVQNAGKAGEKVLPPAIRKDAERRVKTAARNNQVYLNLSL